MNALLADAAHAPTSAMRPDVMKVILVDDHAVVREGVRAILELYEDVQVVGEYANGTEALNGAPSVSPDVALVDLKMPGISAVETIRGLRERIPTIKIMVFTSFGEDTLIRATLDAGATGFLIKDAMQDDLIRAIRSVAQGQPYLAPAAQRQLLELLKKPGDARESLTAREHDVVKLIAEGMSNKQIARKLNLTEGTVKGYVSQILAKLRLQDRTQIALYAVRQGWLGDGSV